MDRLLSDKSKLCVKFFIVGYPSCGESVVVCICDGDKVLYTCVIDSFKYRMHNETVCILQRLGVGHVDLLCWSHPDHDHSFDMDSIISGFCDDTTKFLLPQGVNGKSFDMVNYNKGDKLIVAKIAAMNEKHKICHNTVCVCPKHRMEVESFSLVGYTDEVPVNVMALSPASPTINHRIAREQVIEKNELCISLCLEVGAFRVLLCSDIENPAIANLHAKSLHEPILVKIPHHSSPTAAALLDYATFSPTSTFACTTGYRSMKLPNMKVLDSYGKCCKMVHFTGYASGYKYGVVEYTFMPYSFADVGNEKMRACGTMKVSCHGNALQVYPA